MKPIFTFLLMVLFKPVIAQSPQELFNKAKEAYESGYNQECISLLQSIEKQIGANPKIYSLYVKAYLGIPDYTNAAIAMHTFKKLAAGKLTTPINDILLLEQEINAGLEKLQQEHQKNVMLNRNKEADAVIAQMEQQKAVQKKILKEHFLQTQNERLNSLELNKREIDRLQEIIPDSIRSVYYQKIRNSKRALYQFSITFSDSTLRNVKSCNFFENDEEGIYKYAYSVYFEDKKYPSFSEEMLSRDFYTKSNPKALPATITYFQAMADMNGSRYRQYMSKKIDEKGVETMIGTKYSLFFNKKLMVDTVIEGTDKHVYKFYYNSDYRLPVRHTYTAYRKNKKDYYSNKNITYTNLFNANYKERIESLEDAGGWEQNSKPNPKWVITETSGSMRFNLLGDIQYESYYEKGKLAGSNSYLYTYDQFGSVVYNLNTYKSDQKHSREASCTFIHYADGTKTGYSEYYTEIGNYEAAITANYTKAIVHYEKSLSYKPDDLFLLNSLANVYNKLGKNKEAIKLTEKAIEIDPFYPVSYFTLGIIYHSQGEIEKGLAQIKTASELGSFMAQGWLKQNGH